MQLNASIFRLYLFIILLHNSWVGKETKIISRNAITVAAQSGRFASKSGTWKNMNCIRYISSEAAPKNANRGFTDSH